MSGKDDDVDELTASFKGMKLKNRVTFNPLMGSDSIDPAKRLPLVTGNRLSGNPIHVIQQTPRRWQTFNNGNQRVEEKRCL